MVKELADSPLTQVVGNKLKEKMMIILLEF